MLTSFPDDHLAQLLLLEIGQNSPAVGTQQVLLLQQIHLPLHALRANERLASIDVKVNVQLCVHLLEFLDGKVTESPPQAERLLIAVFHALEECTGIVVDRWVGLGFGVDADVDLSRCQYATCSASTEGDSHHTDA